MRTKADELKEHAALEVAKVRTEIHNAFTRGQKQGFSYAHIKEAMLNKGYRKNEVQYVEQLLGGKSHVPAPQKQVFSSQSYLLIAAIVIIFIGFLIFHFSNSEQWEKELSIAKQTKAFEAEKLTEALELMSAAKKTQQQVAIVGDQLQRFSEMTAELPIEERNMVMAGHATELKEYAATLQQQLTETEARVQEIEQVNAQC